VEKNKTQSVLAAAAVGCMILSFAGSARAVGKDRMHELYDRIDARVRPASILGLVYDWLAFTTAVAPGLA
jgi:hypothetical protein